MPGKPTGPPGGGGTPEFWGLWGGRPAAWAAASSNPSSSLVIEHPPAIAQLLSCHAEQSPAAAASYNCIGSDNAGGTAQIQQVCSSRSLSLQWQQEGSIPGGGGGKGRPDMGMCCLSGGGMGGGGPMGLLMCPGTPLIAGGGPANVPVISLSLSGMLYRGCRKGIT